MPEEHSPLEAFAAGIQTWLFQRNQTSLLQLAKSPPPAAPRGQDLWLAFLQALLGEATSLDLVPLAQRCAGLGAYATPKALSQILEQSPLGHLPGGLAQGLSQSMFALLAHEGLFASGQWHRLILEQPAKALRELEETLSLPSPWETARFLGFLGYPFAASRPALQAYLRFSGHQGRLAQPQWQALLEGYFGSAQKAFEMDRLWDWLFRPQATGLTPSLCQPVPDCFPCPLKQHCRLYQETYSANPRKRVEQALDVEAPEDLSNQELLLYLWGKLYQATPFQQELLNAYPHWPQIPAQDASRSPQDQDAWHQCQALLALHRRFAGQKRLQAGQRFTDSKMVFEHFRHSLAIKKQESFFILLLDNNFTIIRLEEVSKGLINESLVHPREVFAQAVQLRACNMILIHNHPSGILEPSRDDKEITRRLLASGKILGIEVLDHIIITAQGYYSFDEEGLMRALQA